MLSSSSGDADSVDRETDRVSWCCSESGRCILGLFVLPVTWCHCDLCCTRCIPYGQLGWDKEKRISYKPQIVSSFQIKPCCLPKKNELKIRAISILVKKKRHSQITGSHSFLIELCQQQPSHFSFPSISKVKGRLLSVPQKVSRHSAKTHYFNIRQCSSLFSLRPARCVGIYGHMEKYLPRTEPGRSSF